MAMRAKLPAGSGATRHNLVKVEHGVTCMNSRWHLYTVVDTDDPEQRYRVNRYYSLLKGGWHARSSYDVDADGFDTRAAAKAALYKLFA